MQELTPVLLIAGFAVGSLSAFLPAKLYFFVAGIGLCDEMLEIATKTASGRGFLGRALQLRSLVYGQSVQQFGLLHIGLIAGMAVLSWLVLILILP